MATRSRAANLAIALRIALLAALVTHTNQRHACARYAAIRAGSVGFYVTWA